MHPNFFNTLIKSLTTDYSRRGAGRTLLVGALGLIGWTDNHDAVAKNCKKIKNKKKRKKCLDKGNDATNQPTDGGSPTGGGDDSGSGGVPPSRQTVARTFSNTDSITISGDPASPYPSTIVVSGLTNGVIKDINLILRNFSHTWPEDVDILLTATHLSSNALVMADAGGDTAASNITLTLDDQAANQLPFNAPLVNGATYRPANHEDEDGSTDIFPSPAPTPTGNVLLSAFNGQNPNGTWQLFVRDDLAEFNGSIAGGWTLDMLVEIDV